MSSKFHHLWVLTSITVALLIFLSGVLLILCRAIAGAAVVVPPVIKHGDAPTVLAEPTLSVMTLNLAHGRKDGSHQALQPLNLLQSNLRDVTAVLQTEQPDVVALQEADELALWSGNFDHVSYIADAVPYAYTVRGKHVEGLRLGYGTAILSQAELDDALSVTFEAMTLTAKGFVVSTIAWPTQPDLLVDVVSLHFDALSEQTRLQQLAELSAVLEERNRPIILMGDFNTELQHDAAAWEQLATELGLHTYQLESDELETFPLFGHRLDWVLISAEFEFITYRVIDTVLSDHRAVIAEIELASR